MNKGIDMLRIKTMIGHNRVYTLFFEGRWTTLYTLNGRYESDDSPDLQTAGKRHLIICLKVRKANELGGRTISSISDGEPNHGVSQFADDGRTISDSDASSGGSWTDDENRS
jgi:hypothetical protein